MGAGAGEGYRADGEGPRRRVKLAGFSIAACAVTNAEFEAFVRDTGHVTVAELCGWSFVFKSFVGEESDGSVQGDLFRSALVGGGGGRVLAAPRRA